MSDGKNATIIPCIAEGMHWLHKTTGRTNGWDRPAGRRAAAG